MVKSKKLSKSSLAVIVLSLLLILSMVVGMTAAWFTATAKPENEKAVNFGTIVINTTGTDVDFKNGDGKTFTEPLMPGDKVSAKVVVNNTGDAAYYVVKITISGVGAKSIDKWYVGTDKVAEASDAGMPILAAKTGTVTIDQTITLDGTVYDNNYQGNPVSVTYEVRALQAKNITPAQAFAYLTAETFSETAPLSK